MASREPLAQWELLIELVPHMEASDFPMHPACVSCYILCTLHTLSMYPCMFLSSSSHGILTALSMGCPWAVHGVFMTVHGVFMTVHHGLSMGCLSLCMERPCHDHVPS